MDILLVLILLGKCLYFLLLSILTAFAIFQTTLM